MYEETDKNEIPDIFFYAQHSLALSVDMDVLSV